MARRPRISTRNRVLLDNLRRLLQSGESDQMAQAIEGIIALGEPEIYAHLLADTGLASSASDEPPTLRGNRFFTLRGPPEPGLAALLAVLVEAPDAVEAAAWRNTITALNVGWEQVDLAVLAKLPALETLHLFGSIAFIHPEALARAPALRELRLVLNDAPLRTLRLPETLVSIEVHIIHDDPDLQFLSSAPALESVQINFADGVRGLAGLAEMKRLRTLRIQHAEDLENLTALIDAIDLSEVSFQRCHALTSLAGLEDKPRLERLELKEAPRLSSIAALEGATGLRSVRLFDCAALMSLDGLQSATALEMLAIDRCPKLTHIDAIDGGALVRIDLERSESLCSIAGLRGGGRLRVGWLNELPALPGLSGLEAAHQLQSLTLRCCTILDDIEALRGLRALEALQIVDNRALLRLDVLETLPALRELYLEGLAGIRDLEPLLGCQRLAFVHLRGITHQMLAPLTAMPALRELHLSQRDIHPFDVPTALREAVRWTND